VAIYLPVGSLLYIDITPRYNAALTYSPGSKVYYSGLLWKRKTGAQTTAGQTPASGSTYWEAIPRYDAALTYSPGDKVYYSGFLWKRKTGVATTLGQTPASGSTYWEATEEINWAKLSEHNRQPLSLDHNRIEKSQRMSNGTLRKFFIADKKNFSTSWEMLPSRSTLTVDEGYGAVDLQEFYSSVGTNTFNIKIVYGQKGESPSITNREEYYDVSFTSCSFSVVKRNVKGKTTHAAQEFWSVSISMEEV
jgi:hypothetical protein